MNASTALTRYDMSANDTGRAWQCGLSNATMANVNALSEMIDIRNGFKRCQFYAMMMSTVLLFYFCVLKNCRNCRKVYT